MVGWYAHRSAPKVSDSKHYLKTFPGTPDKYTVPEKKAESYPSLDEIPHSWMAPYQEHVVPLVVSVHDKPLREPHRVHQQELAVEAAKKTQKHNAFARRVRDGGEVKKKKKRKSVVRTG